MIPRADSTRHRRPRACEARGSGGPARFRGTAEGPGGRKLKDPSGVGKHRARARVTALRGIRFRMCPGIGGRRLINIHLSRCNVEREPRKDV